MSIHIEATKGQIAKWVLLTGDPLRAKHIAENFLHHIRVVNTRRNMLGYTGTYLRDEKESFYVGDHITVTGSGMGQSSLSIYIHELIREYGVTRIVRVGTCGALNESLQLGDIVIAQGSCTDSNLNRRRFKGLDFAPIADWNLLRRAVAKAESMKIPFHVGNILATDNFYNVDEEDLPKDSPREWQMWEKYGVLAVEMESAELYTVAARHGVAAMSVLTVSDRLFDLGVHMSAEDREKKVDNAVQIALSAVLT